MKRLIIYATAAVLAGCITGCLKDNNNYEYRQINTLEGGINNFSNFPETHSVVVGEEVTFAPEFKFTIDKENPDVSYEWYIDKQLVEGATGATYTFKSDRSGRYQVTFAVRDNKSDVQFATSTIVTVRSLFTKGWCILSDEGGRSVLHFIVPSTVHYPAVYEGEEFTRDSVVFNTVLRDVVPDLGTGPKGLLESVGYYDRYGYYGIDIYDELVVKQDRWAELNGNTLEREVYTDEEFRGSVPEGFSPAEASMTFTAKAVRDDNGLIYWAKRANVADFHASTYVPIGLNGNMKFKRLFNNIKLDNYNCNVVLALTEEDNSLVGIVDRGAPTSNSTPEIQEITNWKNGNMFYVLDYDADDQGIENRFTNIEETVIDAQPAVYSDYGDPYVYWVVILKNEQTSEYSLRYFFLDDNSGRRITCESGRFYEASLGAIDDFRSFAVLNMKRAAVIASGNRLYYYQFGWDEYGDVEYRGSLMPLGDAFAANIKKVTAMDITTNTYSQKYPYDGQVGVLLEDGSFFIFGVSEEKDGTGATTAVSLKQHFPNGTTSEADRNFGNVVDVIYKWGNGHETTGYTF